MFMGGDEERDVEDELRARLVAQERAIVAIALAMREAVPGAAEMIHEVMTVSAIAAREKGAGGEDTATEIEVLADKLLDLMRRAPPGAQRPADGGGDASPRNRPR